MKILHINTALVTDAPGRIAEEIGKLLIANGHQNYIAHGRYPRKIASETIKIGNHADQLMHVLITRIFDKHGFGSSHSTRKLIRQIVKIDPDIIHLHNLHGYYINIEIPFDYLRKSDKPIVWTLHDCWPFTGHCSHYDFIGCDLWKTECHNCPNKLAYPASWLIDNSTNNFHRKKAIFSGLDKLILVAPSEWLARDLKMSFLKGYTIRVMPNGINQTLFKPGTDTEIVKEKYGLKNKRIILGVASFWGRHKGLADFIKLSGMISKDTVILLIGLNKTQKRNLPSNIIGISRTENIEELVSFYSLADVFVNPTYVDTFPTTNLEALSCGTPVITYNTGGSPEAIDTDTGIVVDKGDILGLKTAVDLALKNGKSFYSDSCIRRSNSLFNKEDRYRDYLNLYEQLLIKHQ